MLFMCMSTITFVNKRQQGQKTYMKQDLNIKAYLFFMSAMAQAVGSVEDQCMKGAGVTHFAGWIRRHVP